MPWECCGEPLLDHIETCPKCSKGKGKWTLRYKQTRVFTIPTYVWLDFTLRDSEGEPVPGERFVVRLPGGNIMEGELDENGRALLERLPVPRKQKHQPARIEFPDIDDPDWELDHSVVDHDDVAVPDRPNEWITFSILDTRGDPLANEPFKLILPDGAIEEGTLNADGEARLALPASAESGNCVLLFPEIDTDCWDDRHDDVDHDDVEVPPEELEPITIELLDTRGDPVAGQPFKLVLSDGSERTGKLDEAGTARLEGLIPGSCDLVFTEIDEDCWDDRHDDVDHDDVAVPLEELEPITIELLDTRGEPVAGQPFKLVLSDGSERTGKLDDAGTARIEGLTPGSCDLVFTEIDEGCWTAGAGVDVKLEDVEVEAERIDWIDLLLLDEEGSPIPSLAFTVTDADGEAHEGTLNSDGYARVGQLPPGRCAVVFADIDQADWV